MGLKNDMDKLFGLCHEASIIAEEVQDALNLGNDNMSDEDSEKVGQLQDLLSDIQFKAGQLYNEIII